MLKTSVFSWFFVEGGRLVSGFSQPNSLALPRFETRFETWRECYE